MADAYARLLRRPGVVLSTTPGACQRHSRAGERPALRGPGDQHCRLGPIRGILAAAPCRSSIKRE